MRRYLSLAIATSLGTLAFAGAAPAASPGLVLNNYETAHIDRGLATGAAELVMFVSWPSFQPNNANEIDTPLVEALIAAVKRINAANRRVLLIFQGSPPWANGGHTDDVNYAPLSQHDQDYANFVARVVHDIHAAGGKVDRLQPWNEPDLPAYWKPQPSDLDHYVSMLTKTYDAVKDPAKGAPSVQVFAASTAGNNYDWIDQMLAKAGGKLDGIAVDSASSCATDGPDHVYREVDGRLGRFTFVGFLEVLKVLEKHGVPNMPLLIPVMGISSTNGGPTSCARGTFAGQKPSGVSEPEQARLLKAEFQCLANYPQIVGADWFRLEDTTGDVSSDEFNHYGLYRVDGSPKPSLQAFKEIVAANGGPPTECADLKAPTVQIVRPLPGEKFDDRVDFQAKASDGGGIGLARVSLYADPVADPIRNFTESVVDDQVYGLTPWFGSRDLKVGKHTLRAAAIDRNGNIGAASVVVEKVAPGALARTRRARYALPRRVLARNCTARTRPRRCTASFGRLRPATPGPSIPGKVLVEWQWRNTKGKWRKLIGGTKPATKALTFTARLPKAGRWRVRAVFLGAGQYQAVRSAFFMFRAR